MPGHTPRREALINLLSLSETDQLAAGHTAMLFTGSRQSSATKLFPEWEHSTRRIEDRLHKAFIRRIHGATDQLPQISEQCHTIWQDDRIPDIFPEGAQVHRLLINEVSQTCLALTVAMQQNNHITPGDFLCLDAVEAFLQEQGLPTSEIPQDA